LLSSTTAPGQTAPIISSFENDFTRARYQRAEDVKRAGANLHGEIFPMIPPEKATAPIEAKALE
jgi:hypothetical protein